MWDKPESLHMISNTLFGVCFLLVLYGALHYALHLPMFALRVVSISNSPRQVDPVQIASTVRNSLRGNFFTINLEQTRQAFESIPWVRKVNIRRHFPWQLEIELEEHVALAHWNNTGLVSTRGEIFSAETNKPLPKFVGQPDSVAEMTQMFTTLTAQLAPLKQEITEINLSPRRSWRLHLSNGMQLELGREQTIQRLARFVAVYPRSLMPLQQNHELLRPGKTQRQIAYVDLRYSNGYAAYLSDTANNLRMTGEKAM